MPASPFGKETRIRILKEYFKDAGEVSEENAWEHVYRCLLWINTTAGLAHIYNSNHMQPGGGFFIHEPYVSLRHFANALA